MLDMILMHKHVHLYPRSKFKIISVLFINVKTTLMVTQRNLEYIQFYLVRGVVITLKTSHMTSLFFFCF